MSEQAKLTIAIIDKIEAPESGRIYVRDSEVKGLRIYVTCHNARSWYWVGRTKLGKPESIKLGDYPWMPIDRARREAKRILADIADGRRPQTTAKRAASELTLAEAHRWFMDHVSIPKKDTWKRDENRFTNSFADWRHLALTEISRADVKRLHTEIGSTRGKVAANDAVSFLGQIYRTAKNDLGYQGANPAEGIQRFAIESRDRFLLPSELPRFFSAVASLRSQDARDILMLCLWTGARRGNVAAMEWSEIDEDRAVWSIPKKKTKRRKPLSLVLTQDAIDIIKRRKETRDGPFVFPSRSKTGHYNDPKAAWKRVCAKAGFTDVTIHDIRRTFASYQASLNVSLHTIAKTLGHGSTDSTQIYARLQLDSVRSAVEQATNAIKALGTSPPME